MVGFIRKKEKSRPNRRRSAPAEWQLSSGLWPPKRKKEESQRPGNNYHSAGAERWQILFTDNKHKRN